VLQLVFFMIPELNSVIPELHSVISSYCYCRMLTWKTR